MNESVASAGFSHVNSVRISTLQSRIKGLQIVRLFLCLHVVNIMFSTDMMVENLVTSLFMKPETIQCHQLLTLLRLYFQKLFGHASNYDPTWPWLTGPTFFTECDREAIGRKKHECAFLATNHRLLVWGTSSPCFHCVFS